MLVIEGGLHANIRESRQNSVYIIFYIFYYKYIIWVIMDHHENL